MAPPRNRKPTFQLRNSAGPWAAAGAPDSSADGSPPQPTKAGASALQKYGAVAWFGVILLALAIIPSLYSGLLTGSNMDPTGRLDAVPAAVVNLDEPAASQGETIHLGEDLAEELVHPDEDTDNLHWQPMDNADAQSALGNGDVLAVLTIPEQFSTHAAGLSTGEAADAEQSTLRMQTNDGANIIMGTIAKTIGETASSAVAEGIGEEYVKNVLLGFTEVHDGMQEAAEGAGQVAEGAQDAASGAGDLVVGIDQLADGSVTVDTGAQQLAEGAASADAGSQELAHGATSVNDGAQQLSSGLGQMRSQTESLPSQTQTLADGAGKVAAGVGQLDQGVTALEDTAGSLSGGAGQFTAGVDEAVAGAQQLRDSAGAVVTGVQQVQGDAGTLEERIANLQAAYDAMTDEQRQAALAELADGAGQVTAGAEQAAAGASTVNEGLGGIIGDSSSGSGLAGLQAHVDQLGSAASTAAATVSEVADNIHALSDGADQVAAGAQTLADSSGTLTDGISTAATGAQTLADGTSQLSDGAGQLAARMPALASGAQELAAGSSELSSGLATADDGSRELASGLGDLSDGSGQLFTSLRDGTADVPSYTDQDASSIGSVAALPVSADLERTNEVPSYGYGLAPYFMALALWVGALGYFLMRPAVRETMIAERKPLWRVLLRSAALPALMGVAQSLVMVSVLVFGLDLTPVNPWGLAGFAVLTSVTFMAINQALIALLGPPGRFFALMLIVLQLSAAGGTYPVQTAPAFFQAIHPWLPMTYAVESFRSLIAGGSIGVDHGITVMLIWMGVAVAMLVVAVALQGIKARQATSGTDRPDGRTAVATA
ncbi:YhgE/Pip domain-containing protein [Citricoccus sp.]|uniref:YhgE/Pip domain-containing protein n=1 Tax=Citricoccus sp. TaxID=1978372 RepID=UPI0028BEE9FF|nr:YhgE/Pip domain-containing protein [Citricoccus sp.]